MKEKIKYEQYLVRGKNSCLIYHDIIIDSVNKERDEYSTDTANGFVLSNKCLAEWNKEDFPARERS